MLTTKRFGPLGPLPTDDDDGPPRFGELELRLHESAKSIFKLGMTFIAGMLFASAFVIPNYTPPPDFL